MQDIKAVNFLSSFFALGLDEVKVATHSFVFLNLMFRHCAWKFFKLLNPFDVAYLFLYSLKTSQKYSNISWGYSLKRLVAWNGLNKFIDLHKEMLRFDLEECNSTYEKGILFRSRRCFADVRGVFTNRLDICDRAFLRK